MRRFRKLPLIICIVVFFLVVSFHLSTLLVLLEWTEQYVTAIFACFSIFGTSLGLGEIFIHRGSSSMSFELPSSASSGTPGTGPSSSSDNDSASCMPKVFERRERLLIEYTAPFRLSFVATALLFNALTFGERGLVSELTECGNVTPNPDIVGSGVRCSMYILLLFVFVSLLAGSFHTHQSGTKELGCSVLINLCAMSLSLAMVKPASITPTDYLVVVLMIDTQCVALSATLSSKDALASRFYVGFTLLGQTFAWIIVAYANHVLASSFPPAMNSCITTYWPHSSFGDAMPFMGFKIYWYIHALDFVHSGWLALRHTFQFDLLEKIDREQRGHTDNSVKIDTGFNSLRGTPFSNWLGFSLHPVLLIVTLESHMKSVDTAAWGDWGQMMPLTMLVLGIGHWFYVNLTQLRAYILWGDSKFLTAHPRLRAKLSMIYCDPKDTKYRTLSSGGNRVIPIDSSRLIAMGFGPPDVGEEVHRLLTAKKSNP